MNGNVRILMADCTQRAMRQYFEFCRTGVLDHAVVITANNTGDQPPGEPFWTSRVYQVLELNNGSGS